MNNERTLVNFHKDIILVTRLRIFCTTLFTNNNLKIVIQMYTFQFFHLCDLMVCTGAAIGSNVDIKKF